MVDAKKTRIGAREALALARQHDRVVVAKGTKLVELDLRKERPDDDTLLALIMGPTGNLRAPAIRSGKTLLVGFSAAAYDAWLKG